MSGGAVVVQQNRLMRQFQAAGACSPETACTPEELGARKGFVFRRLVWKGVFVEVDGGRYYLDEEAMRRFLRYRRNMMLGVFLVMIAWLIAYLVWGG